MEDSMKVQIGVAGLEALFKYGLPAMIKMLTILNDKEKITVEDILALRGELDSASYFEPELETPPLLKD